MWLLSCENWAPAHCCSSCSADITTTAASNCRRMLLQDVLFFSVHFSQHASAQHLLLVVVLPFLLAIADPLKSRQQDSGSSRQRDGDDAQTTTTGSLYTIHSFAFTYLLAVSFLFLLLRRDGRFQLPTITVRAINPHRARIMYAFDFLLRSNRCEWYRYYFIKNEMILQ